MAQRVAIVRDHENRPVGYLRQRGHGRIRGYAISGHHVELVAKSDFPSLAAIMLLSAVYQQRAGVFAITRKSDGGWNWPIDALMERRQRAAADARWPKPDPQSDMQVSQ